MGREVRRVPANWEHPKNENGRHIPLYYGNFAERLSDWEEAKKQWDKGLRESWADGEKKFIPIEDDDGSFEDWEGDRPEESDYMPQWPEEEKTHWQMYENVSEGTPISPVMETPEELAQWLADNGASAGPFATASYEQWLSTIKRGFAPSMIMSAAGFQSGVEAMHEIEKQQ